MKHGFAGVFDSQLKELYKKVQAEIVFAAKLLPVDAKGRVLFPKGVTVDYSDGADYSIMGLIYRKEEGWQVIQSEGGGPDYDGQPLGGKIEMLIELLEVLENMGSMQVTESRAKKKLDDILGDTNRKQSKKK